MFNDPQLNLLFAISMLAGITFGALACGLWLRARYAQQGMAQQTQFEQRERYLNEQLSHSKALTESLEQRLSNLQNVQLDTQQQLGELKQIAAQREGLLEEKRGLQQQVNTLQEQASRLRSELESQKVRLEQEQVANRDKVALLESAEKRLQQQFENLANQIFEKKNEAFTQTSKAGLDAILTPLKEQIEGFKRQVTDQYVKEGQERASLKTEIIGLKELNQQITEEAAALTRALKGDNKQQGNWGELVLERILKESGLREGHEFDTQVAMKSVDGKAYQPDVVVHLPNDKDIVIDSKVSLAAYERYFNEQNDDEARKIYLSEHITSLKAHIKQLGKKDYQQLQGIRTLDYVLMFIPVEAAFLLAIDSAPDLVKLALDNNIMLVSPTNLLVALRTINNIWQYEYQNQNAQEIAKKAADLYDKFVGFTQDMEGLGTSLQTVHKRYEGAMKKLSEGRGNLVRKAEAFRELGVQTNKKLDTKLLDKAVGED